MTGYRIYWLALGDGGLVSPFHTDSAGPVPRTAAARCSDDPAHRPPEPDCLCGLYATDNLSALAPLAAGLAEHPAAPTSGHVPVLVQVELAGAVPAEHILHSEPGYGGFVKQMRQMWSGRTLLIEGPGTWRGSHCTITGPVWVPRRPGVDDDTVTQCAKQYGIIVLRTPGDIVDTLDLLAGLGVDKG